MPHRHRGLVRLSSVGLASVATRLIGTSVLPPLVADQSDRPVRAAPSPCGAVAAALGASYGPGLGEAAVRLPLRNIALAYDNAPAVIALAACGDRERVRRIGDAFLAALDADRTFADGRVRNAYQARLGTWLGGDGALRPRLRRRGIRREDGLLPDGNQARRADARHGRDRPRHLALAAARGGRVPGALAQGAVLVRKDASPCRAGSTSTTTATGCGSRARRRPPSPIGPPAMRRAARLCSRRRCGNGRPRASSTPATRAARVSTGLTIGPESTTPDFLYFRRPHLGATAWAVLAQAGWNPFDGKTLR